MEQEFLETILNQIKQVIRKSQQRFLKGIPD